MPPLRPQRNVPKPRRYQSSSSEAEKTKVIKKRGRPGQTTHSSKNMACAITTNHEKDSSSTQCSTATTSTSFSSNIASAKSILNHKNYCSSISSLQHLATTISTFVTSNDDRFVTSDTTYRRYNDLTSDTTKHTAPFGNASYVPPSWEPIPHQPEQVTHVTACNSAGSICDPIVYAMRTSLTSNADHVVDNQLSISTHKQQLIENTQNLDENTQPQFFRPMETSTPELHENLSNNPINEEDKQDKDDRNEQG
ncbi:uncharacterized protein LOC105279459 isoform X2 [Ooceraea biroi]|uniref:uncharacterized protein LOC105279459 isoform X2 n=1 Tax=Ooceraea biroi TaxID=2015173 RepID=UPI0005BACDA0|nr:uncharacterized protein LOC105279459 isoform X2 [Ooceraea biroi]XP_011337584.1 uncharacterized protein LOC105279459 isoform X2 [Ooceraea biroi]XP_011337591.1 uncharacterized protein LOC105279459 isoform X2 [Ooceraea biroi]XP_026829996.1 uncharacterized protein LOC105279459 isoform X2 [Ooceraea biroi]XP_026829997.1 uncharacterized protein LOC105279459 isoform X2 [Ooceraea biroi]